MKATIFSVILLTSVPAFALTADEQKKEGAAVIVKIAEESSLDYPLRDALRSVKRGRSQDAARWAMCVCFEAGLDKEPLSPKHDAGCHWFAALGTSVRRTILDPDERTIRFCAARP